MADNIIYIDADEGAKRVMNNTKLYSRLLVKFKDDQSMSELDTAFSAGDTEAAKNFAHAIKGLAANLSLLELFNQSLEIETQLKSGVFNPDQMTILKKVYAKTMEEAEKVIAKYA